MGVGGENLRVAVGWEGCPSVAIDVREHPRRPREPARLAQAHLAGSGA
jgi:hypothetical protein